MIWYNISELESKISKNELTDKDGFNYLLAHFILSALTIGIGNTNEIVWINLLNSSLMALITIWGLNSVYKANNEIDGKDFFKRLFAINWVISMRLLSILFTLAFFMGILSVLFATKDGNFVDNKLIKDLIKTAFVSLFGIIYYFMVIGSFRRLKPITE